VRSEVGKGSTFTLRLPREYREPTLRSSRVRPMVERAEQPIAPQWRVVRRQTLADDRAVLAPDDRALLIIADDLGLARTLLELARRAEFRGVVASSGEEGLQLALQLRPSAILLDLQLPDMGGWVVLDRFKHDLRTRHIPIHVVSASGMERRSLERGALACLEKPVRTEQVSAALTELRDFIERAVKQLLIVEPDELERDSLVELLGDVDLQISVAAGPEQAFALIESRSFDCMVLALDKLEGAELELLDRIALRPERRRMPIIIYAKQAPSEAEQLQLRRLGERVTIRRVRSPERLFDETALFLHRAPERLPEAKRETLRRLSRSDAALAGRKVMVVDDDVRNIFAITAILEQHEVSVVYAENGADALRKLDQQRDVELVLMDIMMPEMDGYEATRRIRSNLAMRDLPIIALTAKAMKGDREQCVQAGASDYITKPIDPDQLISLLRVWLTT
jgi:CheY-like chemotaxis protein